MTVAVVIVLIHKIISNNIKDTGNLAWLGK